MAADELVELKFRLADGSDIGPSKYNSSATVTSLKEKIIAQYPKGYESYSVSHITFKFDVGITFKFDVGNLTSSFDLIFFSSTLA